MTLSKSTFNCWIVLFDLSRITVSLNTINKLIKRNSRPRLSFFHNVAIQFNSQSKHLTKQQFELQVPKPNFNFKSKTNSNVNKRWNLSEQVRTNALSELRAYQNTKHEIELSGKLKVLTFKPQGNSGFSLQENHTKGFASS